MGNSLQIHSEPESDSAGRREAEIKRKRRKVEDDFREEEHLRGEEGPEGLRWTSLLGTTGGETDG